VVKLSRWLDYSAASAAAELSRCYLTLKLGDRPHLSLVPALESQSSALVSVGCWWLPLWQLFWTLTDSFDIYAAFERQSSWSACEFGF